MEAITFLQHFKPSILHLPLPKKKLIHYTTNFSLANVAEISPETSASRSPFNPSSNSSQSSFDVLNELDSLEAVKARHAQIIKLSKKWTSGDKTQSLILSYLEFQDFQSAAVLFIMGFAQNYLFWNSFMEEFKSFGGDPSEILDVFSDLHKKGVNFDRKKFTLLLKICGKLMDLWLGLEVHANLIKRGLDSNVHVKCALMNFYGSCWGTESANQAFYEAPDHESYSLLWNEAILVNLRNENWIQGLKIFGDMQHSFLKTNSFVVAKVLQACAKLGALNEGKQIHGYVIRNLLESNLLLCNSLINMYMKSNEPELARIVFDSMENRDLSSWNSIISGYGALGYLNEAWKLFDDMEASNIEPDMITWNCLLSGHFVSGLYQEILSILRKMQLAGYKPNSGSITSVLQAICELGSLSVGKEIHCFVIRNGLDFDLHVGTSLLDMYVKNDNLINARRVFDNIKNRNIFAWNCVISGYIFRGLFEEALDPLDQMEKEGVSPDLVTYNILVSGYSISGCIKDALTMIRKIKTSGLTPNVVSWTALISGCTQNGYYKHALKYFIEMQKEGVKPNSNTLASLLRACAGLSLLQKAKEVHCNSIKNAFEEEVFVTTALIDTYSKCGSLKNAYEVFQKFRNKRLASWNSMIGGLAMYSTGKDAISLFQEMQEGNIQPDAITFTALLSACKNSGLINEGWKYFDSMKTDYGITPTIEHYSCMIDLLGRVGYLDEAWDLIQKMPMQPDATVWGAFLSSCRIHKNLELGEIAAEKLFKLEPYNAANYVMLMNLYSVLNRWKDVDRIRELMEVTGVKIGHVWSWIQINQMIHIFSAVGKPHPDEGEIHFELYQLISEMKNMGYVPATECVYQNINAREKEKILLSHTEKLAITYGLIQTRDGAPIRVIKNTRTCSDCHTVAKYISLLRRRDIILKDGLRFHHFSDGKCSCHDFW